MNYPSGNKVYPQYSGTLTVQATPDLVDSSFYNPSNAMQLTMNGVTLLSSSVLEASVHVTQWAPLNFQLLKNGYPRGPGLNSGIVETNGFAQFDETEYMAGYYSSGYNFEFLLTPDSTQEALPPEWLYADPDYVDPFVPSQTILIAPASGELMLQITSDNTSAIDTLYLQSPVKKFLLANPAAYMGDTVDCGAVTAGDTIQFYLHSNQSIVDDMNMYPEVTLGGSGGGGASITVRGGPTSGVSSLNLSSPLLKSLAGKKSPQEKLMAEKIKKIMSRRPLSSSHLRSYGSLDPSGVAGLQQKNVKMQATQGSAATLAAAQVNNPLAMLNFEDETDEGFNNVTANVLLEGSILLGETKYYYAVKDQDHVDKLIVKESSTPKNGNANVTFDDPQLIDGDKLGVYWEFKDAVRNDLTKTQPGSIRLIGRHWNPSQTYKVKLTAHLTGENRIGEYLIKVGKPVRLFDKKAVKGDKNFKGDTEYNSTNDIRNAPLNIDSLCIWYADALGAPPQYIKSQIFQESDKTGHHFNPSYRYEPFKDDFFSNPQQNKFWKDYQKQPFWITESSMGKGDSIPTDHQNVRPTPLSPYPITQIKIGEFVVKYWGRYWDSGNLTVVGSDDLTALWQSLYGEGTSVAENPDAFATEITGLLKEYAKETYAKLAQTRKAASYGILQMLYTTAKLRGYNKGKTIKTSLAPEKLNDQLVEMPFYKSFMEANISENFDSTPLSKISAGTWPNGWEATWTSIFELYNPDKTDYAPTILANSKKFYPQSK